MALPVYTGPAAEVKDVTQVTRNTTDPRGSGSGVLSDTSLACNTVTEVAKWLKLRAPKRPQLMLHVT